MLYLFVNEHNADSFYEAIKNQNPYATRTTLFFVSAWACRIADYFMEYPMKEKINPALGDSLTEIHKFSILFGVQTDKVF
jgi:hypothetical protein